MKIVTAIAEFMNIVSGVMLWIPAYQASLIKLGQSNFKPAPGASGRYARFKSWLSERYQARDRVWTTRHHVLLIIGFALLILSSVLKLFFPDR
jgi:hypothetical protein